MTPVLKDVLDVLTTLRIDLRCRDDDPDDALVLSAHVSRRACDEIDRAMARLREALKNANGNEH